MSEHQRMTTNVNRGLAWLGMAGSLVGVLDIIALLVILNTWISAEQYGIATKCIWIFPILDHATDLGLSSALIQRDDHTETRISTVFWINLLLSVALIGVLALLAPLVAREFYGHAIVGWMLLAYGGKLLLQNAYFVPISMLRRGLRFKELAVLRLIANLVEFASKIGFAAAGFGIWCFVLGPLCSTVVYAVGSQLRFAYRPRWLLSLRDAKDYVTFGLRTSGSQILFYFYTNVDYPIVGYYFGDTALGLYRLAYEIVLEPVRTISNVVIDIAFPAFSRLRHDRTRLIAQFVSFTKLNLITVMTYAAVVFVAATDVVAVLFPDYQGAEHAVRILCAVAVLRAVGFVAPPLLNGFGYPERTLRYMIAAAITMPIAYLVGANLLGDHVGFESVAIAWAVGYPIAFAVLLAMAIYTLGWSPLAYLRATGGVAACVLGAGVAAAGVHALMSDTGPLLRLITTIAVVLIVGGTLLAYTQGLSLRTALRSLRSSPQDGT